MARKKKIINPVPVTVTVSSEYLNHLRRMVVRVATHKGKPVTLSEFIRDLLEHAYPMIKNTDMFEEQQKKEKNNGTK